jgi:hypothetical protein
LFQPPIIIGGVTFSPGSVSTLHTSNRTVGFIVGGQVWYNYQLPNNIVVGIESDAQWSSIWRARDSFWLGFVDSRWLDGRSRRRICADGLYLVEGRISFCAAQRRKRVRGGLCPSGGWFV